MMDANLPSPANVFYGSVCHVCKIFSAELKRCSNCKTVAYCSPNHQKRDWPGHRKLCRIMTLTNASTTYKVGCSLGEFKRYRIRLQFEWRKLLGRELKPDESQMWMFPRVCAECFSKENLKDCSKCLCVAYCSDKHEEQQKTKHGLICEQLKLCFEIDKHLLLNGAFPDAGIVPSLPGNMKSLMGKYFAESPDLERALKSEALSLFCTVAFAIGKSAISRENLSIHVVGASSYEAFTDWNTTTENLLRCFPFLRTVRWFLVGPEAAHFPPRDTPRPGCSVRLHRNLYHEVRAGLPAPDLVAAFNSGIHEFEGREGDAWEGTVPRLLEGGVPLLMTAYTEREASEDLRRVRGSGENVEVLVEPRVNPYASLRPLRDWDGDVGCVSVFYVNGFVMMLRGTGGG